MYCCFFIPIFGLFLCFFIHSTVFQLKVRNSHELIFLLADAQLSTVLLFCLLSISLLVFMTGGLPSDLFD